MNSPVDASATAKDAPTCGVRKPKKLTYEQKKQLRQEELERQLQETLKKSSELRDLIPKETEDEVLESLKDDAWGLWLYQLIHVKSCDVNFTWHTGMLMYRVLMCGMEAETESDFENALKLICRNMLLYNRCKEHLSEIFAKAKEFAKTDAIVYDK